MMYLIQQLQKNQYLNNYTMYGRIRQRKLNQQDHLLSCQLVREQLSTYIDDEAKRVNEDSAKKRAVLQRMDYQGFRQMVLGANLFSLKSNELIKFSAGEPSHKSQTILNPVGFTFNKTKSKETQSQQIVQRNQATLESLLKQKLKKETCCNNFSEFKKHFSKSYTKELTTEAAFNLYDLLKDQNSDRLEKIFNNEFDPIYFSRICEVLHIVIQKYIQPNKNLDQLFFIVRFLEMIASIKNIKVFIFNILSKAKKQKILELTEYIEKVFIKLREETISSPQVESLQNLQEQKFRKEIIQNLSLEKLKNFYNSQL